MSDTEKRPNRLPTLNQVIQDVVDRYLCKLIEPDITQIKTYANELKQEIDFNIDLKNTIRPKESKLRKQNELYPWCTAKLLLHCCEIRKITESKKSPPLLIIYNPQTGLYEIAQITDTLERMIYDCDILYTKKHAEDVFKKIQNEAEPAQLTKDPDLIAVKNGIYHRKTKTLIDFHPDYIFLNKTNVNYNPNAKNPILTMPDGETWDFCSWLKDLTDSDQEIEHLLWCVIAAILRPMVSWDKSIWLYSEKGNNGKGTFLQVLKELCGNYASIQLSDMSKPYALTQIIDASAIITDENDCDMYIDKMSEFKSMVTHDAVTVNRKYKDPITFVFHGLIVQCINSLPKTKDKSDSILRRLLIIPFKKCFTGKERKYIKDEYLHRSDVLEYIQKQALELDIDRFPEPDACKEMLMEYQDNNDSAIAFWNEFEPQFTWDLLPFEFLYALYIAWHQKQYPYGKPQNAKTFKRTILSHLDGSETWNCDKEKKIRPSTRMDAYEPLILEYSLTDYMNEAYKGSDPQKRCTFTKKPNYRGVVRKQENLNNNAKPTPNIPDTSCTCQDISAENLQKILKNGYGIPFTDPEA